MLLKQHKWDGQMNLVSEVGYYYKAMPEVGCYYKMVSDVGCYCKTVPEVNRDAAIHKNSVSSGMLLKHYQQWDIN